MLALVVLVPAIMTHMNNAREAEEVFKTILIIREMTNVEVANHYNDDKRRKKKFLSFTVLFYPRRG